MEGHEAAVKLLIEKGADLNPRGLIRHTPLHIAAECGKKAVAELLIDKGADVDCKDFGGHTPLYCAIKRRIGKLLRCWSIPARVVNTNA